MDGKVEKRSGERFYSLTYLVIGRCSSTTKVNDPKKEPIAQIVERSKEGNVVLLSALKIRNTITRRHRKNILISILINR